MATKKELVDLLLTTEKHKATKRYLLDKMRKEELEAECKTLNVILVETEKTKKTTKPKVTKQKLEPKKDKVTKTIIDDDGMEVEITEEVDAYVTEEKRSMIQKKKSVSKKLDEGRKMDFFTWKSKFWTKTEDKQYTNSKGEIVNNMKDLFMVYAKSEKPLV